MTVQIPGKRHATDACFYGDQDGHKFNDEFLWT